MPRPSISNDNILLEHLTVTVEPQVQKRINVHVKAVQAAGRLAVTGVLRLSGYVSDSADGSDITNTPPTTLKIKGGGSGTLLDHVEDTVFTIILDDNGIADIEFFDNGTATWYLCCINSDGTLLISDAVSIVN